jgi:predicted  nucleic acid-binding Zn-ribbon protein
MSEHARVIQELQDELDGLRERRERHEKAGVRLEGDEREHAALQEIVDAKKADIQDKKRALALESRAIRTNGQHLRRAIKVARAEEADALKAQIRELETDSDDFRGDLDEVEDSIDE